ncbi:MAG: dihydropteroate synthase, partial [bacterium]
MTGNLCVYPFTSEYSETAELLRRIDVSPEGIDIMKKRFVQKSFMVKNISTPGANALKQHVLSAGGEAAISRKSINCSDEKTDVFLSLRTDKLYEVCEKLRSQCWKLPVVADVIMKNISGSFAPWFDSLMPCAAGHRPAVMGVINVTPDSFSDGGLYNTVEKAVSRASDMISAGADIVDIGGESTRPGAAEVGEEEELRRVIPVIKEIRRSFPDVILSVDTTKASVASEAVEAGVSIINDISGLSKNSIIAEIASANDSFIILMHMKGTPRTMQNKPVYSDVIGDIVSSLERSVETALSCGLDEKRICIDPGIGFGKTTSHNLTILKHL